MKINCWPSPSEPPATDIVQYFYQFLWGRSDAFQHIEKKTSLLEENEKKQFSKWLQFVNCMTILYIFVLANNCIYRWLPSLIYFCTLIEFCDRLETNYPFLILLYFVSSLSIQKNITQRLSALLRQTDIWTKFVGWISWRLFHWSMHVTMILLSSLRYCWAPLARVLLKTCQEISLDSGQAAVFDNPRSGDVERKWDTCGGFSPYIFEF